MSFRRIIRAAAALRSLQRIQPQPFSHRANTLAAFNQNTTADLLRTLHSSTHDPVDPSKSPTEEETIEELFFPDPSDAHQHPLAPFVNEETQESETYWSTKDTKGNEIVYVRKVDDQGRAKARGGRKTSTSRVTISEGTGLFTVNGRAWVDYFPLIHQRDKILRPIMLTGMLGRLDVHCRTYGGGVTGQAEATRHALSRALLNWNPEWRKALKKNGLLTRDARAVEMKKFGRKKARKSFTWVKR